MERQKIFYSCGVPKTALISVPDGDMQKTYPAVVLCHGHARHKNDGLDVLSDVLTRRGFVTMRFDFRGCAEGDPKRYQLNCASEWPHDLMNAIGFLCTFPFVNKDRIGLAGISMGAATAVYVTGTDRRVKSTVAMSSPGDLGRCIRGIWARNNGDFEAFLDRLNEDEGICAATGESQRVAVLDMYSAPNAQTEAQRRDSFTDDDGNLYVTLNSLKNTLTFRPVERCPCIATPIFFAHGQNDLLVPYSESLDMYEHVASTRKKIVDYEGVDHNIPQDPHRALVFKDIVEWFLDTLIS